jgi:hypothetical protein
MLSILQFAEVVEKGNAIRIAAYTAQEAAKM